MVRIVIKKADRPQFIINTTTDCTVNQLLEIACEIYNGRLKINRIAAEIVDLAKHGLTLPPNMQGLTEDQLQDLKLKDDWGEKCIPSGGYIECKDELGRRNGKAPTEKMADVLNRTVDEAKALISHELVQRDTILTKEVVREALMMLSGAVTIVYPMGLPPYEPIKLELDNEEDLSGTQAGLEVIPLDDATIWFSGKEMQRDKPLSLYVGQNEKTKIVAKLAKRGQGAPAREPVVSEQEQRAMMAYYHKKQEEWKQLDANEEDSYLNSAWAEPNQLKRQFHGLSNIKLGPR